jgi:tRNA G18 (ribose-2'-O)-methylase SpoU
MAIIERIDASDPRLERYRHLTDVPLRSALEAQSGRFVLEGLLVLERALQVGIVPAHVLVSERMVDRAAQVCQDADVTLLLTTAEVLEHTTGYHVHRGVLADAARPALPTARDLVAKASFVLVLEALRDHANVGAAFRNAAALGVNAVLVTQDCADPLYRRSIKTSMGSVLQVPWTRIASVVDAVPLLHEVGIECVAMTPHADALPLPEAAASTRPRAILVGTEGAGLSNSALETADMWVRIPMSEGPDSLNAAAATAVALYAFGPSSARQ